MGRAHNQKTRDKNKQKLPQTPRKDIATTDEDLEVAKELDSQYELKSRIGYSPTKVIRKNEHN